MIEVILVEPEHPGNIGSIARVMKNFGFLDLVMINPRKDIMDNETYCRAKHAQDVLDNVQIKDHSYLDELDVLIGTTAKNGNDKNLMRLPMTPVELKEKIDIKLRTGILIGREGIGLTNEELAKCDFNVTIPANTKYPTLNISHAVGIILYELHSVVEEQKEQQKIILKNNNQDVDDDFSPATKDHKDNIMLQMSEVLDKMEFKLDARRETQLKAWKRIFGKSMMTKREAMAVFGFLKKINSKIK